MIECMGNFKNPKELEELIRIVKEIEIKGKAIWDEKVLELISERLGGVYNKKIEEKLHLSKSPYLTKVFQSVMDEDFKIHLQELLTLVVRKDFGASLDKLHHNIATKEIFASNGLNYEKWTKPNASLSRSFYDGNDLVEIRQVDMRDVAKSLFLGNEARACTAIGSFSGGYAIPYIMNTLVSAIEVVVNGKPVGNTMVSPIIKIHLIVKTPVDENKIYYTNEVIEENLLRVRIYLFCLLLGNNAFIFTIGVQIIKV